MSRRILILFSLCHTVELANHLKLRPGKPIIVLQGQEAKVKCDSEGISAAKVQWKKQTNSGDVSVPESMVTIVKETSTNRVRAILKFKFAQMQDSGVYKCVLTAFGKTDFKLTTIAVKGICNNCFEFKQNVKALVFS